ncbi:transcriptional regulator, TetR family [Noviherbaspirillum humi]|uniref:Transcriptional regulator, TetR family n=1 Tax=Noviherbaspirillum humi TaxID=1688639 RepID=A0A239IS66_9BURK|nr:TetR/AcrR family transcriptional regulator [Noviherbaspirillum humi]SNS96048.1 transcriptional regulator, TetR family [Noviherbaspirillum humi]
MLKSRKQETPDPSDAGPSGASLPEASSETGARRPRRSQVDRSREAREKLLQATIEVLMQRGYSGLTTKEVASCAGMSNGALMHHYANKAELVVAATAAVYDEAIKRGQRVAKSAKASESPIEGFITDCLSVYFDWPFIAALEVIMVARTDDELMQRILPVMENYRSTTNELWLSVFKNAGMTPTQARTVLNLTLNLVRGMAVNRMWQKDEKHYKLYLKEWVRIVREQIGPVGG